MASATSTSLPGLNVFCSLGNSRAKISPRWLVPGTPVYAVHNVTSPSGCCIWSPENFYWVCRSGERGGNVFNGPSKWCSLICLIVASWVLADRLSVCVWPNRSVSDFAFTNVSFLTVSLQTFWRQVGVNRSDVGSAQPGILSAFHLAPRKHILLYFYFFASRNRAVVSVGYHAQLRIKCLSHYTDGSHMRTHGELEAPGSHWSGFALCALQQAQQACWDNRMWQIDGVWLREPPI